ncbi:NAD(P)/FAD-dependent oxidoreductase [Paenimyroides tangerinum]|nr:NAD(P)/FAD-dependent oxidoreductase [Paenimyroides tangerinum]
MTDKNQFDVIIIGGSYAGLSAAMALGRSVKNVLIIDSGKPCNRYTPHSHNFITHDGAVPSEIATKAKEQVLNYNTVKFFNGLAVAGKKTNNGFEIQTKSGDKFSGKKLVFATGVKDIFPNIKGFEDCWGKSVIHCPYCHGYEFKGEKTAIIANGDRAFHVASLVNNLTNEITIITTGKAEFKEEQYAKLKNHKINIIEKEVKEIKHQNGTISTLIFEDGSEENFNVAYAAIPFEQHCKIPLDLGCETTEMGHLKVDIFQKTTIPGIYACGDNSSPMRSVANAVSTGNLTGAMVNNELTMEGF